MEVEEEKIHHASDDDDKDEEQEAPPPVKCRSTVLDLDCHPSLDLVCCGLVSSELEIYKLNESTNKFKRLARITGLHSGEACRTITFNSQGTELFTGGSDGSLHGIDCSQGRTVWTCLQDNTGESAAVPVNRLSCCLSEEYGPSVLLSGDEQGTIKLWDVREDPTKFKFVFPKSHLDFISDFAYLAEEKRVITTGGDGTLSVFDLRRPTHVKGEHRSEEMETEFLSLEVLKSGKKIVVGTQEGLISIFKSGEWNYPQDTITGHPHSVDCLLKLNEDIVLTGSSDGIIRIVKVQPNKLLGVLGYHDDFPLERMKFVQGKRLVATCSHDSLVRFWACGFLQDNLQDLKEMDFGQEEAAGEDGSADDEDDDVMMMDDDDDSSNDAASSKKKQKKKTKKKTSASALPNKQKGQQKKKAKQEFFEEL